LFGDVVRAKRELEREEEEEEEEAEEEEGCQSAWLVFSCFVKRVSETVL